MERVLTENQMLLTEYLAAVGCDPVSVIVMMLDLWEEEAILEMLEYCSKHPDADQAELKRASVEISSRWREEEE